MQHSQPGSYRPPSRSRFDCGRLRCHSLISFRNSPFLVSFVSVASCRSSSAIRPAAKSGRPDFFFGCSNRIAVTPLSLVSHEDADSGAVSASCNYFCFCQYWQDSICLGHIPRSETAICCSTSPRCACTTISRWLSLRRNEIRNAFLNRPTIGMPVLYVVAINATIWDTATTRSRTTSRIPQQRTGDHATNVHIVSIWRSGAQRWKTQSGSVRTRIVRRTGGDWSICRRLRLNFQPQEIRA